MWGWLKAIVQGLAEAIGTFLEQLRKEKLIKDAAKTEQQLEAEKAAREAEHAIQTGDKYIIEHSHPPVPGWLQPPKSPPTSSSSGPSTP